MREAQPDAAAWDVFLCGGGDDEDRFAAPLRAALEARGLSVWSACVAASPWDDLSAAIDEGLRRARFGVVILSQRLFGRRPEVGRVLLPYWTELELGALINQELVSECIRLLPVRCDLTHAELTARSPLLAARVGLAWERGLDYVAERIAAVVRARRHDASVAAGSPLYNLPIRRAQQLIGREEDLARLEELLTAHRGGRVAVSLTGMVGVGKTEVALHLIDRLAAHGWFPGGIFWFNAGDRDLTASWGGPIARALAVGGGTLEERAAAAVRFASRGAPVLLVLNNVDQWTSASAPWPLPRGANVSLLVTTRNAFLGNDFKPHTLECLAPPAARALLLSVVGRDPGEGVDELLDTLGGHALAIELAGAYLREMVTVTAAGYLERMKAGRIVERDVCSQVAYEGTVGEAFEAAWGQLDLGARRALQIAACFDASEARLDWLQRCGVVEAELRGLRRLHLMTVAGDRWRLHRLLRAYVRRRDDAAAQAEAGGAFLEGMMRILDGVDLADGHRLYTGGREHLSRALEVAEQVWRRQPIRRSTLANRVGTVARSAGDYQRARQLFAEALRLDLSTCGAGHPRVASARSNLALVHKDLSHLETARRLLEQALATDRTVFGAGHPRIATRLSNLAIVLQDLGELRGARLLLEEAVAIGKAALGGRHPTVEISCNNLAGVLVEAGELHAARVLLEQMLGAERLAASGHRGAATACRCNLALVLKRLGDTERARALLEEVLADTLATLGDAHPSVAVLRFNLAGICEDAGDLATALQLYQQTLSSDELTLGADNPSTAYTRARLAQLTARLGQYAAARREILRAVAGVRGEASSSRYARAVKAIARSLLGPAGEAESPTL